MSLSKIEQETIINFNKEEREAFIFTYEETWQKHLEKKLGLKPFMDNGHGGKEYKIDKKRIKPPRAPMKLSKSQREKRTEQLTLGRVLRSKSHDTTLNQAKTKPRMGKTIKGKN